MKQQEQNEITKRGNINRCRALFLALAASIVTSVGLAANFQVTADTPVSFRATFTGMDTDPATIGGGNDFQIITFDFWTVLVNLRGDSVDKYGESGFYEIQLTHSGNKVPNPKAPVVNTFLFYTALQPGVVLTDHAVNSQPNGGGHEYLSTTVNIEYDPKANIVAFNGAIAGDSDLDGNAVLDSDQTDMVVDTLKGLKDDGVITGREMGQIIKETRKYSK